MTDLWISWQTCEFKFKLFEIHEIRYFLRHFCSFHWIGWWLKNQILNIKYQLKVVVVNSNKNEKRPDCPLLLSNCDDIWCLKFSLCLVLKQVPKCFVPVQIFCVGPNIYLHIVPVTNIFCQTIRWFAFNKIGFCAGTKVFEGALNAIKFLEWHKTWWDL